MENMTNMIEIAPVVDDIPVMEDDIMPVFNKINCIDQMSKPFQKRSWEA